MGRITDFLEKALFGNKQTVSLNDWASEEDTSETIQELWSYRLALDIVAETLGTLLSKCEFKTYRKGNEIKEKNYYLLNVEANPNQSAAEFKKQLVRRLILNPNHDALIVSLDVLNSKTGQGLYVASDFQRDPTQIYEAAFKNVEIDVFDDGGIPLKGVFVGSKAIYIKYSNSELSYIFKMLREQYAALIENAIRSGTYRQKYVLSLDQTATAEPDFEAHIQQITNDSFKNFVAGKEAIIPIYAGMKLTQTSAGADLGQNASVANKSVNSINDEALSKVGRAFNIPKSVMLGDFEKDDLENLLTFSLDGISSLISQAFNRRWYGYDDFSKGSFCRLDTTGARHLDVVSVAGISNNVISSGVYSINDLRTKLNEPLIDEEIGDVHFITRNYAVVGDSYLEDPTNNINYESGQVGDNNTAKQKANEESENKE